MKIEARKIKAFTLSEMLVVLLITTIVAGMAFSVLTLVQRQMQGIANNYESNTELNLLRQALWIDFNRCNQAFYKAPGELLLVNALESKVYRFEKELVIRDKDTFYTAVAQKQFYFANTKVTQGEVDGLDLNISGGQGEQRIFVFKRNTASNFMNR